MQQQALRDFHQALAGFFAGTHRFPRWRVRREDEGFRVIGTDRVPEYLPDGSAKLNPRTGKQVMNRRVRVERVNHRWGRVKVPGCGWVRFRLTRKGVPEAKTFRVRFKAGRWHIAFAGIVPDPVLAPRNGRTAGVDRGVVVSAALSTGDLLRAPGLTPGEARRLDLLCRKLSRAKKGSGRRARLKAAIARIRVREADRRRDWIEQTTTALAREFDLIGIEGLNIRAMTASARGTVQEPGRNVKQKAGLNKGILTAGWGALAARLEHKAPGRVVRVRAAYTSQRCSHCRIADREARESQAVFRCRACGFTCNADVNAARNIDHDARHHHGWPCGCTPAPGCTTSTAAGPAVTARGRTRLPERTNREPQLVPLS